MNSPNSLFHKSDDEITPSPLPSPPFPPEDGSAFCVAERGRGEPPALRAASPGGGEGEASLEKMTPYIMKVGRGEKLARPLDEEEAYQAMKLILTQGASPFQTGAFLAAMRVKSETASEVLGFIRAVRESAPKIQPKVEGLFDFGDPYDGKTKSLNLSPLTALIMSAAGCPVILHGDSGIPAKRGIGSGEILKGLGCRIDGGPQTIERSIEEIGMGYFHASSVLPWFGALKPLRLQYGLRSSFNVIEKMWNLCGARVLAVGIYHAPYFESTSQSLLKMEGIKGFVVQGVEGFAELRLSRPTKYLEVGAGQAREAFAIPADFGFARPRNWDFEGCARVEIHADLTRRTLEGEKGLVYDGAVFNAGVKLCWAGKAASVTEGIDKARGVLDAREALRKLEDFIRLTKEG